MSPVRADAVIRSLGPLAGQHLVDLGCGWAQLLLRALATEPTATGAGIDQDAAAIEHGRSTAHAQGLDGRVDLVVGDAGVFTSSGPAGRDVAVLIVNRATQVWGGDPVDHTARALRAARAILRPIGPPPW